MTHYSENKIIKLIFFGNYFYGICAVALSLEATFQQRFPLNGITYFMLVFFSTVFYYSKAYVLTEISDDTSNSRSYWYSQQKKILVASQFLFLFLIVLSASFLLIKYWHYFKSIGLLEGALILLFPIVSLFYYGINHKLFLKYNLRNIGWLKPFIIGFIWAGMVTVYPILFYDISHGLPYKITLVACFLFLKNFMFITVLCIMFDIKDYAMDYNQQLKTFVVEFGLRKTIFYILIPLCIVGLGSFICYGFLNHFHPLKIVLNTIPFILTLVVAYSLQNRRSIFYYLFIIDGLMLVKAFCGITAMIYF